MPDVPHAPPDPGLLAFAFEATAAVLEDPSDHHRTLTAVARLAVPVFADWSVVDVRAGGGAIERVEVFHGDPGRAALATELRGRSPDPASRSGVATAIRDGRSELVAAATRADVEARAQDERVVELVVGLGAGSWVTVPLAVRGQAIGALTFVRAAQGRYSEADLRFAEELGRRIALAIDDARLVRELQRAEAEARRVGALQEQLVSMVSHDLRTPLAAIGMSLDLLARDPLTERQEKNLARIRSSTARMDRIIRDLLDVARSRSGGGIAIEPRPVRLADVCERVVGELRSAHPARDIALSVGADLVGEWDPARLEQVLSNLVSNALQHGTGEVRVDAADDGERVVVAVHDAGGRIAEDVRPRLFQPFARGRGGGTGLGLFIVSEVVRAHGGAVEVECDAATGTTFTVRLPRLAARRP